MMLEWFFIALVVLYCMFILYLWLGWERLEITSNDEYLPSVAVVIPVRNEADNIQLLLNDLQKQTYRGPWEVIVVNDHSEDNTAEWVQSLANGNWCTLLELQQEEGKKAALAMGIYQTQAEVILTTDGDCRVGNEWISSMICAFQEEVHMVSGPVGFGKGTNLFHHMQVIEFASLIGSGAALIGWQKPVMANGANLAFRKSAFEEVDGYGGATTASGDDVFLLHKIAKRYPGSVVFARHEDALVQTHSLKSVKAFGQQRKRWASKWRAYSDNLTKGVAVLVFLLSLSMGMLPILAAFSVVGLFLWLNLLVAKSFFDYFFLRQIIKFSNSKMNMVAFLLLQLVYPYYVVFTALFSFRKMYTWKGRKVQ